MVSLFDKEIGTQIRSEFTIFLFNSQTVFDSQEQIPLQMLSMVIL